MGYVKKEGSSWYFVTELQPDPITGKRKRKKKRGFKTKKEAEKAMALVEAEVVKGVYFEPSKILFKDHLDAWFHTKKNSIGYHTIQTYESVMKNKIVPTLGNIPLSSINPMYLQSYINDLHDDGLSNSYIKKVYNIIKGSLDYAIDMELLTSNPMEKIRLPKEKKKEMSVWEVSEVKAFLNTAKKDRLYIAFLLAITTGMRRGEILGLRWKDIDLENGVIYIRQTLSKDGKHFLSGAKTESGVRSIKLPNETITALMSHKVSIAKEKLQCGPEYKDYDLVVCCSKGTPVNPNNLSRTYKRLTEKAGVDKIRFHDLRHTHATLLLSQGVHAKVISERLGHSDIKVTLGIYSHVLPSMQEEAAKQINDLLTKTN